MDPDQRPHSREKTVSSGSAGVNKGKKVSTSGPVGGGHSQSSGGGRASYSSVPKLPFKLDLKTLLIIVLVIVVASWLLKGMGGNYSDLTDVDEENNFVSNETFPTDSSLDTTVSNEARSKFYTPKSGDDVTIMVYMCGTDLESKYGMATKDMQEMLNADLADNVNIIILTGGCKQWQNKVMSNSVNQIYRLEDEGLRPLEKDFGDSAMTAPSNLTKFIRYCKDNFPAERNMLIFWDHGGGSLSGYGYDEKNADNGSMTLSKISSALSNADVKFDVIGFDACLMATLETALVCEPYADYLLASEESEPGTGWYYTNWLNELSKNTGVQTVKLAQTVIDDFISTSRAASRNAQVTLSLTDLAELKGTVPEAFNSFASSTNDMIRDGDYKQISNARAGVRQFAQSSKINQVDLVDLAQRIGTKESNALAETLLGCVKYNRSSMNRCYGLSIYFPYETTKNVKNAVASYEAIGIDGEYTECIKSFASLGVAGQVGASATQLPGGLGGLSGGDLLGTLLNAYMGGSSSGSSSQQGQSTSPLNVLLGSFLGGGSQQSSQQQSSPAGLSIDPSTLISLLGAFSGRSMPESYDWLDTELIADNARAISKSFLDPSKLVASENDGHKVLSLSDADWSLIQTVELNVFVDDGEGYIDLGLDNTFDWYDDDLLLEYDGTWLTVNGTVCAYYLVSDVQDDMGNWTTEGRIPAKLNDQLVNLRVIFDEKNPQGVITGAYPLYNDGTEVQAKGNIQIKAGDSIQFLCDYYGCDGEYSASYTLGESITVPESGLKLANMRIDTEDVSVTWRLTDIYGNHFWVCAD